MMLLGAVLPATCTREQCGVESSERAAGIPSRRDVGKEFRTRDHDTKDDEGLSGVVGRNQPELLKYANSGRKEQTHG
jgi:hypothetical protein